MAPKAAATGVALNPVEIRLSGGLLALNRLIMTFQNKRMPVAGFTVARDGGAMRATILLECPTEIAQRYVTLLSGLEDVEEVGIADGTVEVALFAAGGGEWRESASRAGIQAHADAGTVVASGEPERLDAWLGSLGEEVGDTVRLGPVARPGSGG